MLFEYSEMCQTYYKSENRNKIILDLCGGTGSWSKPYREAGYDVHVVTLPDYSVLDIKAFENTLYLIPTNGDCQRVKRIRIKNIYGILAAPPCTMFSLARCDKTAKKPRDLRQGMKVVNACLNIIHECLYYDCRKTGLKFWALENPATGYLKRFLGKPALVFNPYEFGDNYSKLTALWGCFNEPKRIAFKHEKTKGLNFTNQIEHFKHLKTIPK